MCPGQSFIEMSVNLGYAHYILLGTQDKKEYTFNQSYARTTAVLPDMGQTEKERGESHEWALTFMLPV